MDVPGVSAEIAAIVSLMAERCDQLARSADAGAAGGEIREVVSLATRSFPSGCVVLVRSGTFLC